MFNQGHLRACGFGSLHGSHVGLHISTLAASSSHFLRSDIQDVCYRLPTVMMTGTMLSGSMPANISLILCSRETKV